MVLERNLAVEDDDTQDDSKAKEHDSEFEDSKHDSRSMGTTSPVFSQGDDSNMAVDPKKVLAQGGIRVSTALPPADPESMTKPLVDSSSDLAREIELNFPSIEPQGDFQRTRLPSFSTIIGGSPKPVEEGDSQQDLVTAISSVLSSGTSTSFTQNAPQTSTQVTAVTSANESDIRMDSHLIHSSAPDGGVNHISAPASNDHMTSHVSGPPSVVSGHHVSGPPSVVSVHHVSGPPSVDRHIMHSVPSSPCVDIYHQQVHSVPPLTGPPSVHAPGGPPSVQDVRLLHLSNPASNDHPHQSIPNSPLSEVLPDAAPESLEKRRNSLTSVMTTTSQLFDTPSDLSSTQLVDSAIINPGQAPSDVTFVSQADPEQEPEQEPKPKPEASNSLLCDIASVLDEAAAGFFSTELSSDAAMTSIKTPEKLLQSIPPSSIMITTPTSSESSTTTTARTNFLGALDTTQQQ